MLNRIVTIIFVLPLSRLSCFFFKKPEKYLDKAQQKNGYTKR